MLCPLKAETILSSFVWADSIVNTRNEGDQWSLTTTSKIGLRLFSPKAHRQMCAWYSCLKSLHSRLPLDLESLKTHVKTTSHVEQLSPMRQNLTLADPRGLAGMGAKTGNREPQILHLTWLIDLCRSLLFLSRTLYLILDCLNIPKQRNSLCDI